MSQPESKNNNYCLFYGSQQGCRNGDKCPYKHSDNKDERKQPLCKWYNTDQGCRFGNLCMYKHEGQPGGTQNKQNNNIVNDNIDDMSRESQYLTPYDAISTQFSNVQPQSHLQNFNMIHAPPLNMYNNMPLYPNSILEPINLQSFGFANTLNSFPSTLNNIPYNNNNNNNNSNLFNNNGINNMNMNRLSSNLGMLNLSNNLINIPKPNNNIRNISNQKSPFKQQQISLTYNKGSIQSEKDIPWKIWNNLLAKGLVWNGKETNWDKIQENNIHEINIYEDILALKHINNEAKKIFERFEKQRNNLWKKLKGDVSTVVTNINQY